MSNIIFTGNILRFSGYGFGSIVRPIKKNFGFILCWNHGYTADQVENVNIIGNTFDCAKSYFFYAPNCLDLFNFSDNTYYQKAENEYPVNYGSAVVTNQAQFSEAVTAIDENPRSVLWID